MEPSAYIPAYLERTYLATHRDLTPAARELLHDEIRVHPQNYAADDHARALLSYAEVRARLLRDLERMDDLPDSEFEQARTRLFDNIRVSLHALGERDRLCVDARLVDAMLADVPVDHCINDVMKLEETVRDYLRGLPGFDTEAPHFWDEAALERGGETAAERTAAEPEVIGWLHALEALSQLCLASARYQAAARYAQLVMRTEGYPNRAVGTLLLALARLEDESAFFEVAEVSGDADESPWFLLARTLLLYKAGRKKPATRALREFAARCEGGAFFLLNPTYMTPYLPVRPPVAESWKLAHQAVWEADGIIADVPDFTAWAAAVEGIEDISEDFAARHGF